MIADNLRRIMKRKMWTQEKLSKECGWSKSSIQGWLKGDRVPNAYAMWDMAKALNVSVLDLYGDMYDRKKNQTSS